MGMTVKEYNSITYYDLMLKIDGFQARESHVEDWFRMVGWSAFGTANIAPKERKNYLTKYWPKPGQKPKNIDHDFKAKKKAFKELLDLVNKNGKA